VKPHVHTPSQQVETWGVNGMKAHLEHDHPEVPLPMRWGVAELHQAHLKAHQAAQTPEEAPVADKHEHGDIARYHDQTDRRSVAYHLEDAHGLDPKDIDVREVYSQHASLHPMKACGAENPQYPGEYACEYPAGHGPIVDPEDGDMPITGTFDHGSPSKGAWWTVPPAGTDEAAKVEARDASPDGGIDPEILRVTRRAPDQPWERVNQENVSITVDRIIAAMAGLDFDNGWASDGGIGLTGRQLLRDMYGEAAKRLLGWLERGGAMVLPQYASLGEDLDRERALVEDLEQVNNTLRQQLATTGRQLEEVTAERDLLRTDKARLKTELEDVSDERNHALEAVMGAQSKAAGLREELETAVAARDRALEAGYRLERERDEALTEVERLERLGEERQVQHAEAVQLGLHAQNDFRRVCRERQDAQDALHQLQGQWDRVVPHLESRLMARTRALANGQAALRALISDLKQVDGTDLRTEIVGRLENILAGQGPKVSTCTEAHLGLATTGELIEEVRTRIDLGHCGLEYRTVDGD
jgi:hypothetical protein